MKDGFAIRSIAALALALTLAGCGGPVELLGNLHEREANEVIAALADGGITARKLPGKDGAVNLNVESAEVAKAISLIQAEGLPRERRASMGDVFRKEGLISSPLEERARYLWALSQELSETISQVDGVIKARVHVVLPERSTAGDPPQPSSASVFVKHRRGYDLEETLPQIRRLVAGSIPGLAPDKVQIVLVAAARAQPVAQARPVAPPKKEEPLAKWGALLAAAVATLALAAGALWVWRTGRLSRRPQVVASAQGAGEPA
jgi:type III secretion protein J